VPQAFVRCNGLLGSSLSARVGNLSAQGLVERRPRHHQPGRAGADRGPHSHLGKTGCASIVGGPFFSARFWDSSPKKLGEPWGEHTAARGVPLFWSVGMRCGGFVAVAIRLRITAASACSSNCFAASSRGGAFRRPAPATLPCPATERAAVAWATTRFGRGCDLARGHSGRSRHVRPCPVCCGLHCLDVAPNRERTGVLGHVNTSLAVARR